jgi:hypothetical protein
VTVEVGFLPFPNPNPNLEFYCSFGGILSEAPATVLNNTHLTCTAPAAASQGNSFASLQIFPRIAPADPMAIPYSNNSLVFSYFNCDLAMTCTQCLFGPCGYCIDTYYCGSIASLDNCSTPVTESNSCPTLLSVAPSSIYVGDTGSTTLSLYANFFAPVAMASDYIVKFTSVDNVNLTIGSLLGTRVSSTELRVSVVSQLEGSSYLSVDFRGRSYTDQSLLLSYYGKRKVNDEFFFSPLFLFHSTFFFF